MASASITPATLAAALTASAAAGRTTVSSTGAETAAAPSAASDAVDRSDWTPVSISVSAVVAMTPVALAFDDPAPLIYWQARHSS
jgi:hypothetical protein